MAKAPARFLPYVIFGVALATGLLLGFDPPGPDPAEVEEATAPTKAEIERLLRLEITALEQEAAIHTPWGAMTAKPATRWQVARYLPLLCIELRKYPPELMARIGLRRVVLCRELSLGKQPRAAVPLREHDSLHIDVVAGHHSRDYQRIVVHHELMHVIDDRDDGKVYEDPEWAALNAPQFRYGNGGISAQHDENASLHTTSVPGFLTSYSTTGIEEDKAELFARLMVEPGYVAKRAREDAILRAKVVRLRELLVAFCPQFEDRAWPGTAPFLK